MVSMDREYRSGVDVRVALLSHLKRALAGAALPSAEPVPQVQDANGPSRQQQEPIDAGLARDPQTAGGRRGLRGLLEPVVKPVVSPIRRYLTVKLREELDRI